MKTHRIHLILAALCVLPGFLAAQTITTGVPGFISYQGRVLNNTGGLVGSPTPVNRTVIFRIWDHPSNTLTGNLIYSEQQTVTIAEGEFSVLVGQGVATTGSQFGYSETAKKLADIATAFGGSTRYLGVTVDDGTPAVDNEITPRQQIVSSAFSFRAKFAETLGTSASTALTTVDGGNVGVGNTNPTARFMVTAAGTGTGSPQMVITADDVTERLRIGVDSTGNGTGYIQSFKEGAGAQNLLLNPSGGRVGIGTTTPAALLDIRGVNVTNKGQLAIVDSANASSSVASVATISGWGNNIGVDTNTTGRLWSVGSFGTSNHDVMLWNQSNSNLLLGTNNAERVRITGSGNVGIGQTNPGVSLEVLGGIRARGGAPGTSGSSNNGYAFNGGSGDTDSGMFSTANGLLQFYTDNAERMRINSTGNVGIGTNTPEQALQIGGYGNNDRFIRIATAGGNLYRAGIDLRHFASNLGFSIVSDERGAGPNGLHFIQHSGAAVNTRMFFQQSNGFVGIRTTAPVCPLDVRGGEFVIINGNYTTIKSEWYVQAFGYGTMSDQRIKNIVDRSDSASDLDTVMKLQVTDYQMKAQVMKGNPVHKGLIAQEVEKVIPEAVLNSEAYVPEIFELAKQAEYDSESKSLKVTMDKPHGLAVGDMVMITSKDAETDQSHYLKVTQVTDAKAFVVGDVAAEIQKAFVFGKQVKDFRSVDYNRVYTTGIGAIQQLKKEKDSEVNLLKDENAALKARVEALEAQTQRLADLEAKDKARAAKLAAIEKLLLENGKPAAQPVSIKKTANGAE